MIKSYGKNLIKSFGFATSDVVEKYMPNSVQLARGIKNTADDATRFIRSQRTNINKAGRTLSRDNLIGKGKSILSDMKKEIKSGKLYDSFRDDSLNDEDLDFDSVDAMFDDVDDIDIRESKKVTMRSKITAHENRQNSEMIAKSVINSTSALLEQSRSNMTLMYSQSLTNFNILNQNLDVINNNINQSLTNTQSLIKNQLDNAATYYAESLNLQKRQVELLEKMAEYDKKDDTYGRGRNKTSYNKVYEYGFDLKEYMNQVRRNFNYSAIDLDMLKIALDTSKNMDVGPESYLKYIPKTIIETLIPKDLKTAAKKWDNASGELPKALMRRITKNKDSMNPILSMIGNIFGIDNKVIKTSKDTSDYVKGRVPWDGKSKKALEEVIPGYLSEIASALTGKENKMYDYEKGKFVKASDINKMRDDVMVRYAREAYEDISDNISKMMYKITMTSDQYSKQKSTLDAVYKHMFENDMAFNSNTVKRLKSEDIGNEFVYSLINKALDMNKNGTKFSRNTKALANVGKLEAAKASYNNTIINRELDIENWLYNKFFDDKKPKAKPVGGNLFMQVKDVSNNSIFDYLRMIEENTRGEGRRIASRNLYGKTNRNQVRRPPRGRSSYSNRTRNFGRTSSSSGMEAALSDDDDYDSLIQAVDELNSEDFINKFINHEEDETFIEKLKVSKYINNKVKSSKVAKAIQSGGVLATTVLRKVLVGDDDDYEDKSLVGHLKDIFDNPDSTMGKYLKAVEESTHSNNELRNMFHVATSKLMDKIKSTSIAQKFIKFKDETKEEVKKSGRKAKQTVKDSVYETYKDAKGAYKKLFDEEVDFGNEVKDSLNKGTHDHKASGGKVFRKAVTILSEGERVLNKEEAEEYDKFNRIKSSLRNRYNERKFDFDRESRRGEASSRFDEVKDDARIFTKGLSEELFSAGSELGNSLFGKNIKKEQLKGASKGILDSVIETFKNKGPSLAAGGVIGGVASLLLGTVGGPLTGAAVGVGVKLIKESETVRTAIFGDISKGKEGLIPLTAIESIEKYLPDMKKYGIAGGLLGLISPLGLFGGIMTGSAIGFVKNNESAMEALFGEDGIIGPSAKDFVKKNGKKMLVGAGIGALAGPFGLVGNMMLGAGLSILSVSDTFKKGLLGEKDNNGIYQNGVLPSIRDKVVLPLAEYAKSVPKSLSRFIKDEMVKPVKYLMKPLGEAVKNIGRGIGKKIFNTFGEVVRHSLIAPVYKKLEQYFLDPLQKFTKSVFNKAKSMITGIITLPFKGMVGLANKLKDKQIQKGQGYHMTATERLAYSSIRNLKVDDDLVTLDQKLQSSSKEDLENIKELLLINKNRVKGRATGNYDTVKSASFKMANISDKLKAGDITKIGRYIDHNSNDDAFHSVLQDIGIKRNLTKEEYEELVKQATEHRNKMNRMRSGDEKFYESKNRELNRILGTEDITRKMDADDAIRRIDTELKFIKRLNRNEELETGVPGVEASPDRRALTSLALVADQTPKFRSTLLDHIKVIGNLIGGKFGYEPFQVNNNALKIGVQDKINFVAGKTVGKTPFDTSTKKAMESGKLGEKYLLNEEFLKTLNDPGAFIYYYNQVLGDRKDKQDAKTDKREYYSLYNKGKRAGQKVGTKAADNFYQFGWGKNTEWYKKRDEVYGGFDSEDIGNMSRNKKSRIKRKPLDKAAKSAMFKMYEIGYISDLEYSALSNEEDIKEAEETAKKDKSKLIKQLSGLKSKVTGLFSKDEDIDNIINTSNKESYADLLKNSRRVNTTEIDDKLAKAEDNDDGNFNDSTPMGEKNGKKVKVQFTKYGPIKWKENDHGEMEQDNTDAETIRTLKKQEKAEAALNPIKKDKTKAKDDDKIGKKKDRKGLLATLFGALGVLGAVGKSLLGVATKPLKAIGGLLGGGRGILGGGGIGFLPKLGGPLGVLTLIAAAPWINEHIVPFVKNNFDSKILPFITEKAIPATVNVVSELLPFAARGVKEALTVGIPLIYNKIIKKVPDIVLDILATFGIGKGSGKGSTAETATEVVDGTAKDKVIRTVTGTKDTGANAYTLDENNQVVVADRSTQEFDKSGKSKTKGDNTQYIPETKKGRSAIGTGVRNLVTGNALVKNDKLISGTIKKGVQKVPFGETVVGGVGKAGKWVGGKFAERHKILNAGYKVAKGMVTIPYRAAKLPYNLYKAGKGRGLETVIETMAPTKGAKVADYLGKRTTKKNLMKAAKTSGVDMVKGGVTVAGKPTALDSLSKTTVRTVGITDKAPGAISKVAASTSNGGFDSVFKKTQKTKEAFNLGSKIKAADEVGELFSKLRRGLGKIVNAPVIRRLIGEQALERLNREGLDVLVAKLSKAAAKFGKKGVTSGLKTGLRATGAVLSAGITQAAFAVYDAYDGWFHAEQYLNISEEFADEIPNGVRFMSAIIKVVTGLSLVFSMIPQDVYLHIYFDCIAPIFGDKSRDKIEKAQKKSIEKVAKYNKKHNTKYTVDQLDKKLKYEERSKTFGGRILNKATDIKTGIGNGIKAVGSFIGNAVGSLWNGAKKLGSSVVSGIKSLFGGGKGYDVNNLNITPASSLVSAGKGPDKSESSKAVTKPGHYYAQGDARWANNKLDNSNMKEAGCGPTSIAMALSNATGKNITPDKVARDNKEHLPGYSTWGLFPSVAKKYNLGYDRVAPTAESFINNLRQGEVILSGIRTSKPAGESPYTNAGHIVLARGIKNGKVEIADPRGGKYNRLYDLDTVLGDMTMGFRYTPNSDSVDRMSAFDNMYAGGAPEEASTDESKPESTSSSSGGAKVGDKVVSFARMLKNKGAVTYSYGANQFSNPNHIVTDCSGFTQYVMKQAAGVGIPRGSAGQKGAGKPVPIGSVGAGDLAVYDGHVGIFTDNSGNIIHNSCPGKNVIEGHYKQAGNGRQVYPRRVLPDDQIGDGKPVDVNQTGSTDGAVSSSSSGTPQQSANDPASSFFGTLASGFMKATADLFGIKMAEPTSDANSDGSDGSTQGSDIEGGDNSTQAGGQEGIHMKINRPDNTSAEMLDRYIQAKVPGSKIKGHDLKVAQEKTGISPVDIMVWAALESNWGRSRIARDKNNFFGIGAFDNNPYNGAYRFKNTTDGMVGGAAWINRNYVRGKYKQDNFWQIFRGPNGDGKVHAYSTDVNEAAKLAAMRSSFYKWARSQGGGTGPEDAYAMLNGRKPRTKGEFDELFKLEREYAGGAPEDNANANAKDDGKKKENKNPYPDNYNGFPYFSQVDKRWNVDGMDMTWTGCGPTAAAMIATAVSGQRVTPAETGKAAIAKGQWNGHNGSSHSIFSTIGPQWGFNGKPIGANGKALVENAKKNQVQIAVGRGGTPFTSGGHYVVVLGADSDGKLIVNNPISLATSGKFDASRLTVAHNVFPITKSDGSPLIYSGHNEVAGGSAGNGSTADMANSGKMQGDDPASTFFGSIANGFMKATGDIFGIGSSSSSTTPDATPVDTPTEETTESTDDSSSSGIPGMNEANATPNTKNRIDKDGNFTLFNKDKNFKLPDSYKKKSEKKATTKEKKPKKDKTFMSKVLDNMTTAFSTKSLDKKDKKKSAGKGLDNFFSRTLNADLSSDFGPRDVAGFGDYHTGMDFDTKGKKKSILSPISGIVTRKTNTSDRGKSIRLKDQYGNVHYFDHLDGTNVKVGDKINPYDNIGRVGSTGKAMGEHLHYEIQNRKDESVNPSEYMEKYGAFGGKQNSKVAKVDMSMFENQEDEYSEYPSRRGSRVDGIYNLLLRIAAILTKIDYSNSQTMLMVTKIVSIMNNYSQNMPEGFKGEMNNLVNSINDTFAKLSHANQLAMIDNLKNNGNSTVNSDIRDLYDTMTNLAIQ